MDQAIDHGAVDDILKSCGSNWNAGQVHGLLCSRLAVTGADGAARWFAQVLDDTDPNNARRGECEAVLDALYADTWRQLVERQSEFTLLLPGDDDSMLERTQAMAQWCEGFLHGLVSEKHSEDLKKRLSADPLADIIKDMLQITRATIGDEDDDEDDDENNENAITELVEYLRVAAQLTYEELADFRSAAEIEMPEDAETLH
jgi:yecA family protein